MKKVSRKETRKKRSNQTKISSKTAYKKNAAATVKNTAIINDVVAANLYFLENFICS